MAHAINWFEIPAKNLERAKAFYEEPAQQGALIYLNGGEDLDVPLAKVEAAGGKIIMPKTSLGPNGFMGRFIDTEGNRVAFHSMK